MAQHTNTGTGRNELSTRHKSLQRNPLKDSFVRVQKARRASSAKIHAVDSWYSLPVDNKLLIRKMPIVRSMSSQEHIIRLVRLHEYDRATSTTSIATSSSFDVSIYERQSQRNLLNADSNHKRMTERRIDRREDVSTPTIYLMKTNRTSIPKETRVSVVEVEEEPAPLQNENKMNIDEKQSLGTSLDSLSLEDRTSELLSRNPTDVKGNKKQRRIRSRSFFTNRRWCYAAIIATMASILLAGLLTAIILMTSTSTTSTTTQTTSTSTSSTSTTSTSTTSTTSTTTSTTSSTSSTTSTTSTSTTTTTSTTSSTSSTTSTSSTSTTTTSTTSETTTTATSTTSSTTTSTTSTTTSSTTTTSDTTTTTTSTTSSTTTSTTSTTTSSTSTTSVTTTTTTSTTTTTVTTTTPTSSTTSTSPTTSTSSATTTITTVTTVTTATTEPLLVIIVNGRTPPSWSHAYPQMCGNHMILLASLTLIILQHIVFS